MVPSLCELIGVRQELTVLDLGAAYNGDSRYVPLVNAGQARIIAFDPDAQAMPGATDRVENFPLVVGDGQPGQLRLTALSKCSSLFEPNLPLINRFLGIGRSDGSRGPFDVVRRIEVQTHRLDEVLPGRSVDYAKLDIQGAELNALRGGERLLSSMLVLELEVEFVELYLGQPLYHDIAAYLAGQGFILHKMIDIHGRPLHGMRFDPRALKTFSQMLWADAVFIRRPILEDPARLTLQELANAATLLHDLYRSYDLAAALLDELDRRHGSDLGARYRQGLQNRPLERRYCNLVDQVP